MISRMVDQRGSTSLRRWQPICRGSTRRSWCWGRASAVSGHVEAARGRAPESNRRTHRFDEPLAHLIEAGADIFLMPSRFEPCGLNQMYSLRYGTVPVVRAVGGLADTVQDYSPRGATSTGFVFRDYAGPALLEALARALALFRKPEQWRALQVRGMRQDYSWDRSAREYGQNIWTVR